MTRRALMPLLFGVTASLAADPASATAGGPNVFRVEGVEPWDVLNMRAGPGARYRIIGTIPHNGRGIETLITQVGSWYRVRYAGRIGWVNSRYIAAELWDDDRRTTWQVVGVASNDVLNVRAGPSAKNPVIGFISPDAHGVAMIGGCHGDWCRVDHLGAQGWVNTRFLAPEL